MTHSTEPSPVLRLPELDAPAIPGTRWVRYPLSLATGCLALLILLFAAVASWVRVDVSADRAATLGEFSTAADGTRSATIGELIRSHFADREKEPPPPQEPAP